MLPILPFFWKLTGIWLAVPLAQIITFGIGAVENEIVAKRKNRISDITRRINRSDFIDV